MKTPPALIIGLALGMLLPAPGPCAAAEAPGMDRERNQKLKTVSKNIGGTDHLFIEAGGFGGRNPPAWKCPWFVMKANGSVR